MEFKSQICTTREQSEKLLKLGLKKETADCHWFYHNDHWKIKIGFDLILYENLYPKYYIPAWSLYKLMKIMYNGDVFGFVSLTTHHRNIDTIYELVIANIEGLIKIDKFNKDYLEEKQ